MARCRGAAAAAGAGTAGAFAVAEAGSAVNVSAAGLITGFAPALSAAPQAPAQRPGVPSPANAANTANARYRMQTPLAEEAAPAHARPTGPAGRQSARPTGAGM